MMLSKNLTVEKEKGRKERRERERERGRKNIYFQLRN